MRCMGYKSNTGCKKISKNPYAHNWREWQLCFDCAVILHPEHYGGKPKHGTGGKYLSEPDCGSLITN